ncbi:MAG: tyrosine-type recombinase/integrase [Proteobacteria bacterium]|nr:tyrosine-type recombinase/integrase [Pseudomonadota bacterium]MBU1057398.1 tyrosine-type recombinase/integrase [Pseudomonadota bacterium]
MKNTTPLDLEQIISRYIRHKRTLGNVYRQVSWLLKKLVNFLKDAGADDLDHFSYEAWCKSLQDHHPNTRRKWQQIVRNFCLYRKRTEPECFIPQYETQTKPAPYVTPAIVEPEQIAQMLYVASSLPPGKQSPLRGPVLRLATVLLYTAGLRLGELLHLTLGDLENNNSILRIRETKFHKTRLVPLSPSAGVELQRYLDVRNSVFPVYSDAPLLYNNKSKMRGYSRPGIQAAIRNLFDIAGVHDFQRRRPRLHDLRHSFAIQALIRWYKNDEDVQTNLPKLALYMGHVSIESTAYYLKWVPTLRSLASKRFEEHFGNIVEGGEE